MTVPLSARSAKKCYDWSEANKRDTSLADAYLEAAEVISTLKDFEAEEERSGHPATVATRLIDHAFDLRDTIGREILKRIKKERKS